MKNRYGEDTAEVGLRLLNECVKLDADASKVWDYIHRDADFSVEDGKGRTALIWAQLNRRQDLERMLKQKGFGACNSKGEKVINGRLTTWATLEKEAREAAEALTAQYHAMASDPALQKPLKKLPSINF